MHRTPDHNRQLFDTWAKTYDGDMSNPWGPLVGYSETLNLASSLVNIPPGARLLDIGIGTGEFARRVAQHDTLVHGIDISTGMLNRCAENVASWDLRIGSFEKIPYPDSAFDTVISSFTFHEVHPANRLQALLNVAACLDDGGTLYLLDIMFASETALQAARIEIGRFWDSSETYPIVGELDEQLRVAGFSAVHCVHSSRYHWIVRCDRD